MKITDVIIRKRFSAGPLYAIVTVVFDNVLAVHDIKAAKRQSGKLLVVMPSSKDAFGKSRDVVHPTNDTLREQLEREIANKLFA